MKKLISLILALMLCLCMLPGAAAEASPALPFSVFQENYTTVFTTRMPDSQISWITKEINGLETWGALMNEALPLVMATVEDGNVTEIIVIFSGELTEENLSVFVLLCGFTGAALNLTPGTDADAAFDAALNDVYTALTACLENNEPVFPLWDASCAFDVSPQEDGTYDLMLIVDLTGTLE